jgi:DNA polymerase-3 subunit epsilon
MGQRQVVLDTETTGLEVSLGHRVIEIGCVEMIDRKLTGRHYHQYIQPHREIDQGALEVHGITLEFLADKPDFQKIAKEFIDFVDGAELVIHNAPFDLAFLDAELRRVSPDAPSLEDRCTVIDSLQLARGKHPGQRNSLDALCQRYGVDNSDRTLHGALLDAEILADVYLLMTGGQTSLGWSVDEAQVSGDNQGAAVREIQRPNGGFKVIYATEAELVRHEARLDSLSTHSQLGAVWRQDSGS